MGEIVAGSPTASSICPEHSSMAGRFQDPEASLTPFGCLMPTDCAFHSTARPLS